MGVGCFAMIVSLSVMNGFETLVHSKLKGFEGDLRVSGQVSENDISELDGIEWRILSIATRNWEGNTPRLSLSDSDFDILQEILNIRRKIVQLYGF